MQQEGSDNLKQDILSHGPNKEREDQQNHSQKGQNIVNSEMKILSAVVAGGVAVTAAGLIRSGYERRHFVIEETTIYSEKIRNPRTLVFLTDLHDKEFGEGNEELLTAIRTVRPDVILIGGDVMVAKPGKANLEVTRRFLDGLCEVQSQTTGENSGKPFRIYYGNGNHEQRLGRETDLYGNLYRQLRVLLKERNIAYLSDRSVNLSEQIRISGLNLDPAYYRDFVPAHMGEDYINKHLGAADPGRFQILLAHSPLYFKQYAQWGADLTLSGHFHGGTIRLPFVGGVMTPQYQFFHPYCAGQFEQDGKHMIVGRGLGTHSINIRFRNRPQLLVIRLLPKQEEQTLS